MNIADAKDQIKDTVEAYLAKDDAGMYRITPSRQRPIFLIGAPGIGKTAIMEQVAQELEIGIVSYSMTHHTRQSALGLPRIVHREFEGFEYESSEYTMSEIVSSVYDYMESTGLRSGILFLDEINCVSETLCPSMLQFLQFKTFGRHRIPHDWIIVCAGNPPEYNKSVHEFDIVTLDRLREIEVEPEYSAWKRYASEKGIHPVVTTFLEAKPDCFYLVESKPGGGKSFVTARGWEDLAETVSLYEEMGKGVGRDLIGQFLRDTDIADRFSVYYNLFDKYRSDYQIMSILAGEASYEIVNRAREAEFDERVALLGLLLDALSSACGKALEQEETVIDLRDLLREEKPRLLDGASIDDTLSVVISTREKALARKVASGTAKPAYVRKENLVINKLKALEAQCQMANTMVGEPAFSTMSGGYRAEVDKIDPFVKDAGSKMDNAFEFIEKVWKNAREMLVFVAELTTRQTTTQFIAHYGNESYYAHNDELQVDAHRRNLSERVRALDLNAEEAVEAGDVLKTDDSLEQRRLSYAEATMGIDMAGGAGIRRPGKKAVEDSRPSINDYYGGKQFEYGFASMSKMTLPSVDQLRGKTVLDICCRRGKGCFKFSAKVGDMGHVLGTDWAPSYVAEAKEDSEKSWRKNGLKGNNMEFKTAYPEDLMSAGIGDGTMDIVYINNVMTLLYDQGQALKEFYRVLRPGGLLICETIISDTKRDDAVVEGARSIGNSIQAGRTKEEIIGLIEAAGFAAPEFLDSYAVEAETGFKANRTVEVYPSDEKVKFEAVVIHATK
jgi:ubiquinone/menaquinone biosynthesis C-methylase UbiE